jgi:Predicted exonuclease of the beta-lactamase fold involved in RNA processing
MALHNEVTGSCNLMVVKMPTNETFRIVVDCGLFQEKENDSYNRDFPFDPEKLDCVLVTHNHVDHTGRLPLLTRKGYRGDILCTPATKMLMPLALADSCKVLKDTARRNNTKQLYDEVDVQETVAMLKKVEFGTTIKLNRYMKATFFKNGHLLGAALILIQIQYENEEAINLLFTGDYNNKNMFFDVPDLPKWVKELPITIVQESTYGNMDSEAIVPCFRKNIAEKMAKGGTTIVPVFSLGRSQEILKVLRDMQDSGELDPSIPIYFDGKLAIKYTHIYLKDGFGLNDDCLDFLPHDVQFVDDGMREKVLSSSESKIVVTTSGSGTYGPAPLYFQQYISDPNCLIHFTGFLFEGSLGRMLKEKPVGEMVKISGMIFKKYAEIQFTAEFSAHAKANEMIDFLNEFKNLKAVLVNHGESDVKDAFAERIVSEVSVKNVAVLDRSYFFRISPWGIAKSFATKFF